jgi:rubrerythrin
MSLRREVIAHFNEIGLYYLERDVQSAMETLDILMGMVDGTVKKILEDTFPARIFNEIRIRGNTQVPKKDNNGFEYVTCVYCTNKAYLAENSNRCPICDAELIYKEWHGNPT